MLRQHTPMPRADAPAPSTGRRGGHFDADNDFNAFMSCGDNYSTVSTMPDRLGSDRMTFQGSGISDQLDTRASVDCNAQAMSFSKGHKIKVAPLLASSADNAQFTHQSSDGNSQSARRQDEAGSLAFHDPFPRRAKNDIRLYEESLAGIFSAQEFCPTHVGSSSTVQALIGDLKMNDGKRDRVGSMSGRVQVGGESTFWVSHDDKPFTPTSSPLDNEQLVRHNDCLMKSSYDLHDLEKRDLIVTSVSRKPVCDSIIRQHEKLKSEPTPIGPSFEVVNRLGSSTIPMKYHQDVLKIFGDTKSFRRPSDCTTCAEASRAANDTIPGPSVPLEIETTCESSINIENYAKVNSMTTQSGFGRWDIRLKSLKRFLNEFGHFRVPEGWPHDHTLYLWIKRQRVQYRRYQKNLYSTLTAERIEALERLGFVFEVHKRQWEAQFEALAKFSEKNGHCNVSRVTKDSSLAIWIKYQRLNYRNFMAGKGSNLTTERIAMLRRIGLDLEPQSR